MAKKLLVERKNEKYFSKGIEIVKDPALLSRAINKESLKILNEIAKTPSYPKEIAKNLKMDRQKVYYYIHKLEKSGLIKVVKEVKKKGAICKFYSPVSEAFGFEFKSEPKEVSLRRNSRIEEFFEEFVGSGIFDGLIVVGSPTPHGPFLTAARDGHYAIQLAMLLGSFCDPPKKYIVKLDTEVKAEREERKNLILIGGPITNMISNEINDKLKIRFRWRETWRIFSEFSKKEYGDEDLGIIAKVKNPWNDSKRVILLSGLRFEGTKTCIIAVVHFPDELFEGYEKERDFFAIIRGLDRNGDGKVDDIEVVEKYN